MRILLVLGANDPRFAAKPRDCEEPASRVDASSLQTTERSPRLPGKARNRDKSLRQGPKRRYWESISPPRADLHTFGFALRPDEAYTVLC
jgi:hypothetical protein